MRSSWLLLIQDHFWCLETFIEATSGNSLRMAFTTHAGITRRFFFPNTPWTHQVNWRYAAKRHALQIEWETITITTVPDNGGWGKNKLHRCRRHACLFTMGSGKGLQRALWIATSAVFRTSVSKKQSWTLYDLLCKSHLSKKSMKTRQKLINTSTSRCLTTEHSKRNRAGKSNLIHRTFDLAPQVLDNRNIPWCRQTFAVAFQSFAVAFSLFCHGVHKDLPQVHNSFVTLTKILNSCI